MVVAHEGFTRKGFSEIVLLTDTKLTIKVSSAALSGVQTTSVVHISPTISRSRLVHVYKLTFLSHGTVGHQLWQIVAP